MELESHVALSCEDDVNILKTMVHSEHPPPSSTPISTPKDTGRAIQTRNVHTNAIILVHFFPQGQGYTNLRPITTICILRYARLAPHPASLYGSPLAF